MKQEELELEAERILGEEVSNDLQKWYKENLLWHCRYVVFFVRRSYILALLMEIVTKYKMQDENGVKEYLTDAALFLRVTELADYYREYRRFPNILLCDDILIHGRNMNRFIQNLEDLLVEELKDFEKEEVKDALVAAVRIHVYIRANDPVLLLPRYELGLESDRLESASFWRRVSSDISTLILRSGMANASYIFSAKIGSEVVHRIKRDEKWICTTYHNIEEFARITMEKVFNRVYVLKTIRVIKSATGDDYRVIPFVFLPNLDEEETRGIWEGLSVRLGKYREWEDYKGVIAKWRKITGLRSFNEWLSLMFSNAVLREFMAEYAIGFDEVDLKCECEKLARNYNWKNTRQTNEFLKWCINQVDLKMIDVTDVLLQNIKIKRYILEMDSSLNSDFTNQDLEQLEDYFYEQACGDEIEAYQASRESFPAARKRTVRNLNNCVTTIRTLGKGKSYKQLDYIMAYFLQMMDAGILALSSYASSDINVVGYSQFEKAGEQSLFIYSIRYNLYFPLLYNIEAHCQYTNRRIEEEMDAYFSSEICKIEGPIQKKLKDFIVHLRKMGQLPSDWRINYIYKVQNDNPVNDQFQATVSRIKKQNQYVENYMEYLKQR